MKKGGGSSRAGEKSDIRSQQTHPEEASKRWSTDIGESNKQLQNNAFATAEKWLTKLLETLLSQGTAPFCTYNSLIGGSIYFEVSYTVYESVAILRRPLLLLLPPQGAARAPMPFRST
jgi:hypothetical protein